MPRYTIRWYGDAATARKARSAVSLHSHTSCSLETLAIVGTWKERGVLIRLLVERAERMRIGRRRSKLDFSDLHFTPPLPPREALEMERRQIECSLDLESFVSLTDHDTFESAEVLHDRFGEVNVPFSTEWTVPFESSYIHLGIHNVPRRAIASLQRRMHRISQGCGECRDRDTVCFGAHRKLPEARWRSESLGELLDEISGYGDALTVLNHPAWDLGGIGDAENRRLIARFLAVHGHVIHAVEVNGLRPWKENGVAISMSEAAGLPIVAGGDRHGCEPAAMLNLSQADCFAGFVSEIRRERRSQIVLMPQYREPLGFRKLQAVWDVLREYPEHSDGKRHWTDRILVRDGSGHFKTLSELWEGARSGPFAIEASRALTMSLERWPLRNAVRLAYETERRMAA